MNLEDLEGRMREHGAIVSLSNGEQVMGVLSEVFEAQGKVFWVLTGPDQFEKVDVEFIVNTDEVCYVKTSAQKRDDQYDRIPGYRRGAPERRPSQYAERIAVARMRSTNQDLSMRYPEADGSELNVPTLERKRYRPTIVDGEEE